MFKKIARKISVQNFKWFLGTEIKRSKMCFSFNFFIFFQFSGHFCSMPFIFDVMFYLIYIVYSEGILEKSSSFF